MKRVVIGIIIAMMFCIVVSAQETATTSKGKEVILYSNGTWVYQGEETKAAIQIIDKGCTYSSGIAQGFAKVRNNSKIHYTSVTFSPIFYDKAGNMVGAGVPMLFKIDNFKPGTIRGVTGMAETSAVPSSVDFIVDDEATE